MYLYLQGECEKNGEYMVEGHTLDGEPVPGHCQLSCAICTLQVPSGSRPYADIVVIVDQLSL